MIPTVQVLKGTTIKMQILWDYPADPAVSLDSVDFYVEYFTSPRHKITLQSSELVREEGESDVRWYAYVQSSLLSAGRLMMRLHASIPDIDAPEGVKVEYTECTTNVVIYV